MTLSPISTKSVSETICYKISPKFKWSQELSSRLIKQVHEADLPDYPPYIIQVLRKTIYVTKWKLIRLHKEDCIPLKTLKCRFYEVDSPKVNKSNFTPEEDAFLLEILPTATSDRGIEWTKVASLFFSKMPSPLKLYRPSLQLKNRYGLIKKSTPSPVKIPPITPLYQESLTPRGKALKRKRVESPSKKESSPESSEEHTDIVASSAKLIPSPVTSFPFPTTPFPNEASPSVDDFFEQLKRNRFEKTLGEKEKGDFYEKEEFNFDDFFKGNDLPNGKLYLM